MQKKIGPEPRTLEEKNVHNSLSKARARGERRITKKSLPNKRKIEMAHHHQECLSDRNLCEMS